MTLETTQGKAKEEKAAVDSPWDFDGVKLRLRPHGWFSYGYWLTCDVFDVMVSDNEKLPVLFVQLRQAYLYEVGDPLVCYQRVYDWLVREFLAEVEEATVARLDLCADIIGYPEADLDPTRYTTRAQEWHTRGKSGRVTGLEWGVRGSPCFVRLYDKTLEAYVHRKTWMDQLWLPHGWDPGEREPLIDRYGQVKRTSDGSIRERWKREPERVFRLEFELRGEFLDRFAHEEAHRPLKRPPDVLRNAGYLWEYLTGQWVQSRTQDTWVAWLALRVPTADSNRTRWPPPDWWQRMAEEGLRQARLDSILRRQQGLIDAHVLLRQAAGCIAQRAAIVGDTTMFDALDDFAREWTRLLDDRRTSWKEVLQDKQRRYEVRRLPLEKRAQAGVKREKEDAS